MMDHPRIGDWMQTHSGRAYWPMDPRHEDVDIADIAHALSMICRFGGHVLRFYSVAEHSVHVSRCVPPEHALQALMHDATEAYIGDMVRPLKQNMPVYERCEANNWRAICQRFDLPEVMHPSVKVADNAVLLAEKDALLVEPPEPWTWAAGLKAAPVSIVGYMPDTARELFMDRFNELKFSA